MRFPIYVPSVRLPLPSDKHAPHTQSIFLTASYPFPAWLGVLLCPREGGGSSHRDGAVWAVSGVWRKGQRSTKVRITSNFPQRSERETYCWHLKGPQCRCFQLFLVAPRHTSMYSSVHLSGFRAQPGAVKESGAKQLGPNRSPNRSRATRAFSFRPSSKHLTRRWFVPNHI